MDTELIRSHILQAFFTPSPSVGLKTGTAIDLRLSSPFSHKPYRYEFIGGKHIRVEVEPVHVTECQSYKTSKIPLLDSAFNDTAWLRAINLSPRHYRVWVAYCYNNDLSREDQEIICNSIWNEFIASSNGVIAKKGIKARLKTLLWLNIQNTREIIFTGYKLFNDSDLSRVINIHRSHWAHTYKKYWERMTELCFLFDEDALESVHSHFKKRHNFINKFQEKTALTRKDSKPSSWGGTRVPPHKE
ncbi:bacteriophage antitermination protein Q [Serratia fonticola]|uniref:bacteriophage antitermination protein Q n=1 Tax=Serratia fonticola TaxID=47917 RepID=UPI00301E3D60